MKKKNRCHELTHAKKRKKKKEADMYSTLRVASPIGVSAQWDSLHTEDCPAWQFHHNILCDCIWKRRAGTKEA